MSPHPTRSARLLAVVACIAVLAACATGPAPEPLPPIVFVHGNGDTAALWTTTLWRFEIGRASCRERV